MKPFLTALAAAFFLLLPALALAGYVIHLKDGSQFVTDQYVEEGDRIKFKRYGGLIRIQKDLISGMKLVKEALMR
jgi:hypothetical protein